MNKSWPKIFRDPVHNVITFEDNDTDRLLLDLINCREFQRLRRVKQLGFTELVFPGANHSRFAHSIGVMNTARQFLQRISDLLGKSTVDEHKTVVLAAALLHDIGHGPFSHAFEKITGEDHERWTEKIIRDEATEVNAVLTKHSPDLVQAIAGIFDPTATSTVPAYMSHIVSSQLDADRSDYLLRDSHATGTDYGRFDLQWLISHLYVDEKNERLFLSRKALYAAEAYIFARYHMYQTVYFHKATRAAEVMLRLLFKRYKELLGECANKKDQTMVVPDSPDVLVSAFSENLKLELHDFISLDDSTILQFLKSCDNSEDKTLRKLSSGLLDRCLYKCIDATYMPPDALHRFSAQAKSVDTDNDVDKDFSLEVDTANDTPYKVYDPGDNSPATQIYIEDRDGKVSPLNNVSKVVDTLKDRITTFRYYFPPDLRSHFKALESSTKK